jgi:hypothetical protein
MSSWLVIMLSSFIIAVGVFAIVGSDSHPLF